jgi:DNA recombination protein RmuC
MLAKKAYWKQFEPNSPEFVVCFVPGEALLAAAFEADPSLIDRAMDNKVLLTGPVNLIALLKTVGLGWRQEQLATNAAEIQEAGRELYERLVTFAGHLSKVGRSLNSSLNAYNDAVGSLERRVLPSARRFERLGVTPEGGGDLEAPAPVDGAARRLEAPEIGASSHPAGVQADLHLVEPDEEPLDT